MAEAQSLTRWARIWSVVAVSASTDGVSVAALARLAADLRHSGISEAALARLNLCADGTATRAADTPCHSLAEACLSRVPYLSVHVDIWLRLLSQVCHTCRACEQRPHAEDAHAKSFHTIRQ